MAPRERGVHNPAPNNRLGVQGLSLRPSNGDASSSDEEEYDRALDTNHPVGYLHGLRGEVVRVKLNSGLTFKGKLQSVDGYMNVAIEGCHEYLKDGLKGRSWGDAFIRGNTVTFICAEKDVLNMELWEN
ncbi:Sm-like ribonucleoprotein [Lindgomyces ingoldianus]|uniref:Sm-like ribonucleoprotein n=1 Tax=Lindgomyces ingoldianus TaxID=673940 RepID=A0ACB6R5F9_9PLEO|nr:Sm-like ribonucleoprotein [Lindgomyces ingoldianus]KAF2474513.1 Sm-like ribonucleoprotein [Lindgomyces ingoldianus]